MSETQVDATAVVVPTRPRARPGRKLDHARDASILDATLAVLAECGYEGMTIDMVAVRARAARATVYRRWATKADLVLDAVARMSRDDAAPDQLPDTGSLREDLLAMIVPHTQAEQQLRIRVMSGLQSVARIEPRLAEAAAGEGMAPWVEANRALLQRAVDRGEYPPGEVETLASVVPMMCIARAAVQQQPITREFSLALIDGVIIPAMRGTGRAGPQDTPA